MIEFGKPKSESCNACTSGEAVVSLEFSSTPHSSQAIRLCRQCLSDLNTRTQQFIIDHDLIWGKI
jgi:hypothetical protein